MNFPFSVQFYLKDEKIERVTLKNHESNKPQFFGSDSQDLKEMILHWLLQYQTKKEPTISLPLDFSLLSDFCKKTYQSLRQIAFGKVISYQELAGEIGKPKGARAIGNAMKSNPFPLIIPCHRVIQKNGKIGGFFYGSELKIKLLHFEEAF